MSEQAEQAVAMFSEGFNCAQAVLCTCARDLGISRETALSVAGPFGGGMGSMGNVCGAVTGAFMVIGMKHPRVDPQDETVRLANVAQVREFAARFEARNGSLTCKDLLGLDLADPEEAQRARELGLFKTVCPKMVRDAAEILDDLLG